MRPLPSVLSLLLVLAPATAQPMPRPPAGFDFLAPIHTRPGEGSGAHAIWASGPDYRASFHDGFAFWPVLGERAPESLPLRWRTIDVAAGGASLIASGETAEVAHGAWRLERRHAAFTEAYDVRRDGVEQSFVVHARPAAPGAIVVTGKLATRLFAAPVHEAHAAITFVDDSGQAVVRYGAAFAVDAAGTRTPLATSFDGELVQLVVPADVVAAARFPLVIDPLTSRVAFQSAATTFVESDVGADGESQLFGVMVAATRQVAQNDRDLYAWLCNSDFTTPTLVFAEIGTTYDSRHPSVAFVAGANRWVLAFERVFGRSPGVVARCAVYAHDRADTTFGSGGSPTMHDPLETASWRRPDIGGTKGGSSGNKALLVCEYDPTLDNGNGTYTTLKAVVYDAAQRTFGQPFEPCPAPSALHDRERPSVTQASAGGALGSWVVVWQDTDHVAGTSRIRGNRVAPDQTLAFESSFDHLLASGPQFRFWPQVAGCGGRYLATYIAGDSLTTELGREIHTLRFDWDEAAAQPTNRIGRVLASDTVAPFQLNSPRLAYDSYDTSHWGMLYRDGTGIGSALHARRLGYTGGVVEARTLAATPTENVSAPAIAMDTVQRGFPIVFAIASISSSSTVYAQRLDYAPDAAAIAYGTGCGGSISAPVPNAGYENFLVRLFGAKPAANAVLLLSGSPASLPLDGLGMAGCTLQVSPAAVVAVGSVTGATGSTWIDLPLRDAPVVTGDVYCQWAHTSPQANPLALLVTAGLEVRVR